MREAPYRVQIGSDGRPWYWWDSLTPAERMRREQEREEKLERITQLKLAISGVEG